MRNERVGTARLRCIATIALALSSAPAGAADCDPSTRPLLDLEPSGGDGTPDAFETTLGARRCWRLHPIASNDQVAPTPNGAVYYGRATLLVDGTIPLDSRPITVVVPP